MKQSTDLAGLIKINVPWANGESAAYVREVPDASQATVTPGAASWTDGFPPLTATARASGGIPPSIQDMNGALKRLSGWTRYIMAAGVVPYDATWQAANGGYPLNALVSTGYTGATGTTGTLGRVWVSLVDGNMTNPDTGGAGWLYLPLPADVVALAVTTINNQLLAGGVATFSTAGTSSWTVPAGVTVLKRVTVIGGGGGGGGIGTNGGAAAGGSGGSWVIGTNINVAGVSSIAVTVGAAGVLGNGNPTAGGNGGASSFGSYLTAPGGIGGASANGSIAPPTSAGGTVPSGSPFYQQGGLGAGGIQISGVYLSGVGGGSLYSGPSAGTGTGGSGSSASGPGGGGGGAAGTNNQNGAPGRAGLVIVEW